MATQLTPLEQVQEDAKRLTLKRIAEQEESKVWQEAQEGTVTLEDKPEVAVEPEAEKPKAKTVSKKGKK
jgi:hypothetical protein